MLLKSPYSGVNTQEYLLRSQYSGGAAKHGVAKRNPFARNEVQCPKPEEKLRFPKCPGKRFALNEGRCAKTQEKLRFPSRPGNPFTQNEGRSAKTVVKLRF